MLDQPPAAIAPSAETSGSARCLSADLAASLLTLRSRDGAVTAVIAPSLGGALVGLQWRAKGRSTELLHRGMNFCPTPDFDGKAPLLWPATGRTYLAGREPPTFGWRWQGQEYAMPLHGFARDRPWRVVRASRSAGEVVLRLDDDDASRALYPFRFGLTAAYGLKDRTLTIRYRVTAGRNAGAMPFSIGNHVTFALPLGGVGDAGAARLSSDAGRHVALDAAGRPAAREAIAPLALIPVATFGRQTAYPLAGYRARTATAAVEQPGWGTIAIAQTASMPASGDPVRFNLWGDAAAGYFAVEPWLGSQNGLTTGEGLVRLAPGRTFGWTVTFRIDA